MPSSTFFRLPEEKRERLLTAARHEFSRVSCAEASINRIIREAGIPRGSFYMYFNDKADLFQYLAGEYARRLADRMEEFLWEEGGDLLAAFERMFDDVLQCCGSSGAGGDAGSLMDILRRNPGLRHDAMLPGLGPEALIKRFIPAIDTGRLSLVGPEDLTDMIRILVGMTGPLLCGAVQTGDAALARERYHNSIAILRRGMAARPASLSVHRPAAERCRE